MAKVKSSGLRNYVGKLGGSVYYMLNGENVAREKAASISNPRTAVQMGVRTALGNLVSLYRTNKSWMERYAFPERPANQSVYNAFVSANLRATGVHLTKEQVAQQYAVLAPLTLTKGTLGDMYCEWDGDVSFDIPAITFGDSLSTPSTMGNFAASLISGSNGFLKDGDQISLVLMCQLDQGRVVVSAVEYTLDVNDTEKAIDVNNADSEHPASKFVRIVGYTQQENTNLSVATDALRDWGITTPASNVLAYGMVCVVSRKDANGKIRVSTSHLGLSNVSYLMQFTSTSAKNAAARSYGSSLSMPFLAPGYDGESAVISNRVDVSVTSNSIRKDGYVALRPESGSFIRIQDDTTQAVAPGTYTISYTHSSGIDPEGCTLFINDIDSGIAITSGTTQIDLQEGYTYRFNLNGSQTE